MRLLGPRDDEEARRIAVEAVHDSRTARLTSGGTVREEPVDERAAPVTGGRMDDHARGFVDHQNVVVLVGNSEPHVLRFERRR